MKNLKKIIKYILNKKRTIQDVNKKFIYLFTSKNNDKYYGIQEKSEGIFIITYYNEKKNTRYEITLAGFNK